MIATIAAPPSDAAARRIGATGGFEGMTGAMYMSASILCREHGLPTRAILRAKR